MSQPYWGPSPETYPSGPINSLQYNNNGSFNGSSALSFNGTNLVFGIQTILNGGATTPFVIEPVGLISGGASGTINFYISQQSIINYPDAATANWTMNLTFSVSETLNAMLAIGQAVTLAFFAKQGSTAYYNNVIEVDGTTSGVTVHWQGGTAPTSGNASGTDIYTYTVIKTASVTFDVYASQTRFS